MISTSKETIIGMNNIICFVCNEIGCSLLDFYNSKKNKQLRKMQFYCYFIAKNMLDATFKEISELLQSEYNSLHCYVMRSKNIKEEQETADNLLKKYRTLCKTK